MVGRITTILSSNPILSGLVGVTLLVTTFITINASQQSQNKNTHAQVAPTPDSAAYICPAGPAVNPGSGTAYQVTVASGERQSFKGFGASQVNEFGEYDQIPENIRPQLWQSVYKDLKMNTLRMWVGSETNKSSTMMKDSILSKYVNNNMVAMSKQNGGVTVFLLAPARGESTPTDAMSAYADKLADAIKQLNAAGVQIDVTGIANEPQGFSPQQVADAVRYLRANLDGAGLQHIGIVAPEAASADGKGLDQINAIKGNTTAWAGLQGIATHSYNMAATEPFANTIAGTTKEYWITESSDNGHENVEDEDKAVTIASRFLNDMNHRTTDWIFFIGFSSSNDLTTDNDSSTKLAVYDIKTGQIFYPLKYHYFKQLRTVFDFGTVFRYATSATEGDMTYTYGQKPAINVAAGKNTDGSWAASITNDTGVPSTWGGASWYPAKIYNVNLTINELAAVPSLQFAVYKSSANNHAVFAGLATMQNGKLTLTVNPKQLVSIRSCNIQAPTPTPTSTTQLTPTPTKPLPTNVPSPLPTNTPLPPTAIPTPTSIPTTGNGLKGSYFANKTLSGTPTLTRIDPFVNFNWSSGSPASSIPSNNFSVRWNGYVVPKYSQSYTFYTQSDDGVRLWVNGVQIINNWTNHASTQNSGRITLTGGKKYSIKLEYYENTGNSVIGLFWSSSSQAKQVIPQTQLYSQ